ncbi:MAG: neuromedin U [Gemmatimonadaceae bacterium]
MRTQRTLVAATGIALIVAPAALCRGQQETDSAREVRHSAPEAKLAKAAQNPVANMVSLPLQYNFTTAGGLDSSTALVLNVQPVLPLPIGERWLIVSRTVVPFLSLPLPNGQQAGGIGDIQEQAYLTKAKPGKLTWALGPVFSFPTATNESARSGQWGLGPGAVVLVTPGPWVIGVLANNIWRIGGAAHGDVLNTFTVQPFINFNLPHAWAISTSPLITSNWSASRDDRWTVPIGLGVSKVAHIVEQPLNLGLQYYHDVSHPHRAGSEELRLFVAALWPTAAAEEARKKKEPTAAEGNKH